MSCPAMSAKAMTTVSISPAATALFSRSKDSMPRIQAPAFRLCGAERARLSSACANSPWTARGRPEDAMTLRFLVVEGNDAEASEAYRLGYGRTASQAYADLLRAVAPDAVCDLCFPAVPDASPPAALADYDAAFITGSALNLYDGGPAVARQIALARAVYAAGTPFFGSCWGLQVACAAAGGQVIRNPRGREIGVARSIWLTPA